MNPAHFNTFCFIGQVDSEKMPGASRTEWVRKTNKRRRWFNDFGKERYEKLNSTCGDQWAVLLAVWLPLYRPRRHIRKRRYTSTH